MVKNESAVAMWDQESASGPAVACELLEPRILLAADPLGLGEPAPVPPVGPPTPAAMAEAVKELARDNNAFAFDLYQALRTTEGSLFFSPFSISSALSMTYAGAAGETARQMAEVLHFTLPDVLHHAAFGALLDRLAGAQAASVANSIWGQPDYDFLDGFLATLADEYDSPMRLTDFIADPEAARVRINDWVSDKTMGNIPDLIPAGLITKMTRLVLVNAIYFKASWKNAFDRELDHDFHLPDGDVNVQMMAQTDRFAYAQGEGYQAIDLPYTNGTSMTILLPAEGQFDSVEASLSGGKVETILGDLRSCRVHITMPQFECRTEVELSKTLQDMGMTDAFGADADFSLMNPHDLFISKVVHQAWIKVDKEGTEAAAATAVIMDGRCAAYDVPPPPPVEFMADRPFIYMIRDTATGSILFVGRVNDASILTAGNGESGQDEPDPTDPVFVGDPTLGWRIPIDPSLSWPLLPVAGSPLLPRYVRPAADGRSLLTESLRAVQAPLGPKGIGRIGILPNLQPSLGDRFDALDIVPTPHPLQPDWLVSPLKDLGPSRLMGELALPL